MDDSLDVVVIGSCMIDLISYVPNLPRSGETVHGSSFTQGFGGKGANQCVMATRLGARCAMVAKVGDDDFGYSTIKNFKNNGINTDHVTTTSEASSGVASITVNERGENAIVIVGGANNMLQPEEVGVARDLIARAKIVVCQLEIKTETTLASLKMAKQLGVTTVLNAAPGLKGLSREFFESTDILCLNETEAEVLTGLVASDVATATRAITALQCTGTKCIILTLGEKGLLYSMLVTKEGSMDWTAVRHIEAENVSVVDTTGAGDAFVGALAFFLVSSPSSLADDALLREILVKAGRIASLTVTARGTQTSYNMVDPTHYTSSANSSV